MKNNYALMQAASYMEAIKDLVSRLSPNGEEDNEEAREAIFNMPLKVAVRSDWVPPGTEMIPQEYCILLSTGGPACRIIGDVAGTWARLEWQDWGSPWKRYLDENMNENEAALLVFASFFNFAE